MQNHYNLVYREEEREMIPQCIDQGVAVLPWSPLARGLLAGNRTREGERLTTRASTDAVQESSSVIAQAAGTANTGPTTAKRSIESNVVVEDGQIIVLGGLIEDKFSDGKDKVPLLGDLPLVGALFRSESRTKTRTNLMVFLRPVVLRDADSTNKLSLDRYDLIRAQQQNVQPANSIVMPINESPVLPERTKPAAPEAPAPLNPPPSPEAPASAPAKSS